MAHLCLEVIYYMSYDADRKVNQYLILIFFLHPCRHKRWIEFLDNFLILYIVIYTLFVAYLIFSQRPFIHSQGPCQKWQNVKI